MESVVPIERSCPCPNCTAPISSMVAQRSKCGLIVSGQGVDELAEIERCNRAALDDSLLLKKLATPTYFGIVIAYMVARTFPEIIVIPVLSIFYYLTLFWLQFFLWHRHPKFVEFPNDDFETAKKTKNLAGLAALPPTLASILYVYLNW